jgi:hypothetical protein
MSDKTRSELLLAIMMLWVGGLLIGLAIAIFAVRGLRPMPAMFAGGGVMLSAFAIIALFENPSAR